MKLGTVFEQDQAMAVLGNLGRKNMHHAVFLYGPAGSGKSLAAHGLVQRLLCEEEEAQSACGECHACKQLLFFKSQSLLSISLDDRLPLLHFAAKLFQCTLLQRSKADSLNYLLRTALQESYRILDRHNQKILKPLKLKKASLPNSHPLTEKTIEELFHRIHGRLQLARAADSREKAIETLLAKEQIADLASLQNSLDTSHLSKESLLLAMQWAERRNAQKCIIIKGIEKIHALAVSVFLKHCEDPPPNTYFILIAETNAATLNKSVASPLLSRTMRVAFKNLQGLNVLRIAEKSFGIESDFLKSLSKQQSMQEFLIGFQPQKSPNPSQAADSLQQSSQPSMNLALRLLSQKPEDSLTKLLYAAKQHPYQLENLIRHCFNLLEEFIQAKIQSQNSTNSLESKKNHEKIILKPFLLRFPLSFTKTQALLQLLNELQILQQTGRIKNENILLRIFLALRKKSF